MSAIVQARARESEPISKADPETLIAVPAPERDDPLQLLREAMARLNSSSCELRDQTGMADLLAEVREALERANVIARVATQCDEFLRDVQFDKALEALDGGLLAYPGDLVLATRRNDVGERQRAFQSAATVRTALEEAQWLLNQGRLDLAARFLKEKALGLPDQSALISRLAEIEALLPQWEQDRHVQAALSQVAALEELQQWQVALTAVEEALQSYSASAELTDAARRVRDRLTDHERQKKLARRLELIGLKIATSSWRQALTLLEDTEREFAGAPELEPLRRDVEAGLKRAECEAIVKEVRQCLADGEPGPAEQVLRRGVESLGPEPVLEGLREELESERNYREELRKAQILFGRRQLVEAENVLAALVVQNRKEAQALLDAVRHARAVTEEENFCERGREKALRLMQQQQFAQAVDLLRNLRSLFPDNPILERDLVTAQGAVHQESHEFAEAAGEEDEKGLLAPQTSTLAPLSALHGGTVAVKSSSRVWRKAIVGAASLVLVSAGAAAFRLSHNGPSQDDKAVSRRSAQPTVTQPPVATQLQAVPPPPTIPQDAPSPVAARPIEIPQKSSLKQPAPAPPARQALATVGNGSTQAVELRAPSLRLFVPPPTKQRSAQVQGSVQPVPPETEVIVSAQILTALPEGLVKPIDPELPRSAAPAPAIAAQPTSPTASVPAIAAQPASPTAGNHEAQLINRTMPIYPDVARQRHIVGVVRMEAMVDEHGTVKNVRVLSGDPILAAAARNAVSQWKYKPATLNNRPTATTATIQVSFE